MVTDPIADMLTRIRNALTARKDTVDILASNEKKAIAKILLEEGFIKDVELIDDNVQGTIRIALKYGPKNERVITGLKRISSRPQGLRRGKGFAQGFESLWHSCHFTPKGIMTDKAARRTTLAAKCSPTSGRR